MDVKNKSILKLLISIIIVQHYKRKLQYISKFQNMVLCSSGIKHSLTKALTLVLEKMKKEKGGTEGAKEGRIKLELPYD